MSSWPLHPLGTAIELAYGKSLPKSSRAEEGAIPVYGSNGIAGWHNKALLDGPTVIVGRKGSAGAVQFVDGPCYPIDTTYFVRPRAGFDFDIKFLFYLLRRLDLSRLKTATGVPGLTREDAYREMIPLPPLDEQRRIVDLLARAEGIVRLRREAEKKAAELIPALFLDMFGDPATNPKGWKKTLLGDLCTRITDGTHQPPKFQESGIPFIFVANIVQGRLTLDASKFISDETYEELTRRCPIERDDVLYSTVGSYGVPVKVDTDERFSFQRHIAHLKPDREQLDSDFLVGMLATPALKAQADSAARGIAQKTINLGEIRKYQVIAPPIEAQRGFATKVEAARSIQFQQTAASTKAQETFDALLASVFMNRSGYE